jgi:hypothetical protein
MTPNQLSLFEASANNKLSTFQSVNQTKRQEEKGSDEAYTPEWHLGQIRKVFKMSRPDFSDIDIDPCTRKKEDGTNLIGAKTFFTKKDNALEQLTWNPGRIPNACLFMNPPYSKVGNKGNQSLFLEKLIQEMEIGNVAEAIALMLAGTMQNAGTSKLLGSHCKVGAMVCPRIQFVDLDRQPIGESNRYDTCLYYFGNHPENFIKVFGETYTLWQPVKFSA